MRAPCGRERAAALPAFDNETYSNEGGGGKNRRAAGVAAWVGGGGGEEVGVGGGCGLWG